ncbi:MAG: ATP-binding cassette domain-containing protein [Proteobacteria bacterium]|nr:ATP-binding cassette domain-containing protein [Pseudomonadota bacterium]
MTRQRTPWFGRVLWELIRRQPIRYSFALFLWIAIWTMPILVGLIIARFFDLLVEGIEVDQLAWIVAATFAYALGRSVFIFLGMRNHGSMLFRAGALMRRNLLERVYELPGAAGLDETPGEVVSRFRDDIEHVVEPFDISVDIFGAGIAGVISFLILWNIDPVITLVVSIPVVVVGVVANRTGAIVRRYRSDARDATEAITGFLGETFAATQSVKVAGAEPHMLNRFKTLNDVRRTMMVKDRTLTAVLEATFRNTVNIGTGLILLLAAGRLGATGSAGISIGQFALFVYLIAQVTDSAYFYGMFIARAKQGSVSAERLTSTLSGDPWDRILSPAPLYLEADDRTPIEPLGNPESFTGLSVRDLTYRYPSSGFGISDVDLEVGPGEFVVVTGKIGSGKTTLLRSVLGLLPADSGSVAWNGVVLDDPALVMTPPRVAYTPQVPRLFSMSLRNNLDLGADLSSTQLNESIHIATMTRDLETMPEGLETLIGPRGVRLSGGQVQRSASARMFAREAQLLVLDDVSSALDIETERTLWSRLFDARSGVAALVVSHRHTALARADRVVVMDAGRVVAVGKAVDLERTSETFRAIWEGALGTNGDATRGVSG